MSDVVAGEAVVARRGARDILRTIYIHGTLVMALVGYVVVAGPLLLVLAYTVDRRRVVARRLARGIFTGLIRHFCWLGGHPLVVDLRGLVSADVGFSQRTQRTQREEFDKSSPSSVSSVRTSLDGNAEDLECVENLGPAILVANHASSLDSILLMMLPSGLGDGRVWAKGWPFKMPLLGWLMSLSGHLLVEDFNLLPDAEDSLADGESLLVFPESSRTRSGKLGRFRDGAFLLAVRTGRPIVPVALHGSFACFPPGQPWVFRPKLKVEVLGILRPEGADHMALKKQAHEMIEAALEKGRG